MAYSINDNCSNCGVCEPECSVDAISESGNKRVIDAALCIDCGVCVSVCPSDAIDAG